MTDRIRVLIVDDHTIVRKGIRALLMMEPDIEVVGEAHNGAKAVAAAAQLHPSIILMDVVLPDMDGIKAMSLILGNQPEVRILILTSCATDDKIFPAIRTGALGYLLKDSSPEDLIRAIREVHRGESSLHPTIARKVLREMSVPANEPLRPMPVSEREMEVLQLIARGLSDHGIAKHLVITKATVRTHVSSILSKLHLSSRTQAALYALREGFVSLDSINSAE